MRAGSQAAVATWPGQMQAVVGAVEGQEVDVGVPGREQPVGEGKAVAGGQQPAVGPGQADGQMNEVPPELVRKGRDWVLSHRPGLLLPG
jgi:hypothetical protein